MRASENISDLAAALAKVQGGLSALVKNREVAVKTRTGGTYTFSYTTFDAIIEAVRAPMADNGLAFAQGVGNDGVGSVLTTRLMHASGQWIESDTPILVTDNGAQAFGSGMTYAKRYALSSMLGIATDFDDDGNGSEGNGMESRDRHQRQPAPRSASIETGRPLRDAHQEIRSGAASTVTQAPKPKAPPTAKEWANGDEAKAWLLRAATEIAAINDAIGIREWQDANAASINALDDHHVKRHEWLMDKINTRLDEVRDLRPAA